MSKCNLELKQLHILDSCILKVKADRLLPIQIIAIQSFFLGNVYPKTDRWTDRETDATKSVTFLQSIGCVCLMILCYVGAESADKRQEVRQELQQYTQKKRVPR